MLRYTRYKNIQKSVVMFLVKNVKNNYEYFSCYILFLHIGSSSLLKYAKQNCFLYLRNFFVCSHQCSMHSYD